jgi:hypothetical protein
MAIDIDNGCDGATFAFVVPLRSPIAVIGRSCDDNVDNSFGGGDGSVVESVRAMLFWVMGPDRRPCVF